MQLKVEKEKFFGLAFLITNSNQCEILPRLRLDSAMVSYSLKVLPLFVDVVVVVAVAAGLVPSCWSRKAIALATAVPRNIVKRSPHSVM